MNGLDNVLIEDILKLAEKIDKNIRSDEIEKAINKLKRAKSDAQNREKQEQRRKEQEEKERKEREIREQEAKHVQEVTCMDLPLDWNNYFDADERVQGVHIDSISDGLILCLNTLGRVDIEYIASITGNDYKTVINTLKGSIYQNPNTWNECFYKGWEMAEEYLSGNLMSKWKIALNANEKYAGYFQDNVEAIEKVIPSPVATEDIYITLGSPWVPADIIEEFILYLFSAPLYYSYTDKGGEAYSVIHDEITGAWQIPNKFAYKYSWNAIHEYGTEKINGVNILERTLNMKTVSVMEDGTASNGLAGKKVINKAETVLALEKQKLIIKRFQEWVWRDERRKNRLETIFQEKYGCNRKRHFDGSFLEFPTMSKNIELYPYQKDAVARIIFSSNTLLAHDVGAGKTYVMIAAGQELRRMGLSKKNMYVVPNNIVGQWRDIFYAMYPQANLLCIEPKTFKPSKREKVLESIRDNDYDGIVIAYSCFEQIPLSNSYCMEDIKEKIEYINEILSQKNKATSKLKRKKETLSKVLSELAVAVADISPEVCFEELGITRLFVDEAHNYKNIPIETQANNVLGINSNGSKKCKDMLDKVHMIQKYNDGKGVIFATGTPITNSITDAYVMQQFLQSGELGMLDLQSFDSWIGMFAERVTEFEVDVDTSKYRLATRFAKFHNLPELTTLLSSVADFYVVSKSVELPEFSGYNDALIAKTSEFENYLKNITVRVEDVRKGWVNPKDDNMLKITTDGRKAALDMRLVNQNAVFSYQSKVARCSENVADIYYKTVDNKATQVIFCDTSTPKNDFNLYSELKEKLMNLAIPEEQIAFIHSANTESEKKKLFERVRKGEVRILIGSTFKLGIGVNIQDKLIALHHMDVPWRPADMTQREGRIFRQGNTNKKIHIYRYITEGSFDAYSWQLLETKQRFITGLLSGSLSERSGSDIDDTVLSYAEVKALAVGNPLIKKRVEIANELSRFKMLQRKLMDNRVLLEEKLFELPRKISRQEEIIEKCRKDIAFCELSPGVKVENQDQEYRKYIREMLSTALASNVLNGKEKHLVTYRGFDIILPANMLKEKPYVWLSREGRYYVELGDTQIGNLIRIDNFIENLAIYLDKLKEDYIKMTIRKGEIEQELSKGENYLEEIETYKMQLEQIDKDLGVKKDE